MRGKVISYGYLLREVFSSFLRSPQAPTPTYVSSAIHLGHLQEKLELPGKESGWPVNPM